jgi:serine/threonine protein kinase
VFQSDLVISLPLCGKTAEDTYGLVRPLFVTELKNMADTMLAMLTCLLECGIVHGDLHPSNLVLFEDDYGLPQWKLIDFDSAAKVGEPLRAHQVSDFSPPELYKARSGETVQAAHSVDMYALGRLFMWFVMKGGRMWPNLPAGYSDEDMEAFMLSAEEFNLDGLEGGGNAAAAVQQLVKKDPMERLTLQALKVRSRLHAMTIV